MTSFGLDKIGILGEDYWCFAGYKTMPYSDFDVESLSRFLHLAPQQVIKLAERGHLPGRKIGGEWKFSKPDIHHWFENRIGLSDEEELVLVESVLQRSAPLDNEEEIRISELLPVEAIAVPLHARTRSAVIDGMVNLAAGTTWLWDPKAMADAVRSREEMHPTALENSVALMHPRRPMPNILAQPFLALGCTVSGIPFGSDCPLTDVFFLICSTDDRGHLHTLARLSRLLTIPGFLNELHQAQDANTAHRLIVEAEKRL
ncbi:MAG: PTS sugar transporter subunit IIA [Thermoguttaceae bacterium]|jgi:PTS system nitrogen regulatory IIA component